MADADAVSVGNLAADVPHGTIHISIYDAANLLGVLQNPNYIFGVVLVVYDFLREVGDGAVIVIQLFLIASEPVQIPQDMYQAEDKNGEKYDDA